MCLHEQYSVGSSVRTADLVRGADCEIFELV